MKILHCSDWHLGQTLFGFDRLDEHVDLLNQLAGIAASTRPDVMLICGDIFDTAQPSAAAQRVLVEGLLKIRRGAPDMRIIAIAGNHDSGVGHESHRSLWQGVGCEMVGTIHKLSDPRDYIFAIEGKGIICALPYVPSRNCPEDILHTLYKEGCAAGGEDMPIVLAAHLTVSDSDFTGHQAYGANVGGIDAIDIKAFRDMYDYVALGHIHRPQTLGGEDGRVRYSGSLTSVSFDEQYAHGVTLVEIDSRGEQPTITPVELKSIRPLVSIPTEHMPAEEAIEVLKKFDGVPESYIRLNVETESHLPPGTRERVAAICNEKGLHLTQIHTIMKSSSRERGFKTMTIPEFVTASPLTIAERYFTDRGMTFDAELRSMLEEAAAIAEES